MTETVVLGPFSALIFDQDGTLLDAEAMHCESWRKVGEAVGSPFDEALFRSFAGKGDPAIAAHVANGCAVSADELIERKRSHYRQHLDEIELMPGARAFLELARAAGMTLALATISPEAETRRAVQNHGLDALLSAVVHRESEVPGRVGQTVRSKPAPDIYLAAAALLGVDPSRCCAFEDSLTGVQAARAAGMAVVAIPTPYSRHFDYSAASAVARSFSQINVDALGQVTVER